MTKPSPSRDPKFDKPGDREASSLNRDAYKCAATAARSLNATAIILGSAASLFKTCGDKPEAKDMAELRRLHQELLHLTETQVESAGRAMAFQVCQERARWLDLAPDLDRKVCMNTAIEQEHIFKGALTRAVLSHSAGENRRFPSSRRTAA